MSETRPYEASETFCLKAAYRLSKVSKIIYADRSTGEEAMPDLELTQDSGRTQGKFAIDPDSDLV